MSKKTKTPEVIDREGKQGNVFSVDGSNDITVGEGERAGIDWLEFPVIARARVDAADGKAEGLCQGNKEYGDGGIGMVTEAEAAFTDWEVGEEP
jgi:hypothetical protein